MIKRTIALSSAALLVSLSSSLIQAQPEQDTSMSFFITSTGLGDGANLGGLAGADAHCTALAEAAGSSGKMWHAYLSADGINAADRIGTGPWFNSKGENIANSLDDLHYSNANLTKERSLTESGTLVNGRGDQPNEHDILTGTNPDGSASELTCNNWTSNAGDGQAMVGHFDRQGGGPMPGSWNAAHPSRGCGADNLRASGGNGYFYCFAE